MIENLKNKMSVGYLQNIIEGMGYSFFTKGNYNVNIIGVRNPNLIANSFDDTMLCAYKIAGKWVLNWRLDCEESNQIWQVNLCTTMIIMHMRA